MKHDDLELGYRRLIKHVNAEEGNHTGYLPSIYMVPSTLRDLSPSSFSPRVVSIGPLHREDQNLKEFEKQKASYMKSLMGRIRRPQEGILKSCMKEAFDSLNKIKASYVWPKSYSNDQIVDMMVTDACFMLEFLTQMHKQVYDKPHTKDVLLRCTIKHDLLLLENQIPFFFLDKIFQCTILIAEPSIISLINLIQPLLDFYNLFDGSINPENNSTHHILSLLHQCYKPQGDHFPKTLGLTTINSAVNLERAGVMFKPNKDPIWVMEMKVESHMFPCIFGSWSNTVLHMPILRVQDFTELVLRNLIAYEQSYQTVNHITSYVATMDMLVNTREDVVKLVDSNVIFNIMGSHEEAAKMINNLCKNAYLENSIYDIQCQKLNKYCNRYWPKHIAKMRSTYFSSPWSVIALLAGIILFGLTVVQTIYTIKSV